MTKRRGRYRRRRGPEYKPYNNLRLLWDTRWTENTEEFRALVRVAVAEAGSVAMLSRIVGLKQRHLRRILAGHTKAISFRVADCILARSEVAYRLSELEWITVSEVLDRGIWKPQKPFLAKDWEERRDKWKQSQS